MTVAYIWMLHAGYSELTDLRPGHYSISAFSSQNVRAKNCYYVFAKFVTQRLHGCFWFTMYGWFFRCCGCIDSVHAHGHYLMNHPTKCSRVRPDSSSSPSIFVGHSHTYVRTQLAVAARWLLLLGISRRMSYPFHPSSVGVKRDDRRVAALLTAVCDRQKHSPPVFALSTARSRNFADVTTDNRSLRWTLTRRQ